MATAAIISFGTPNGVYPPNIRNVRVRNTVASLPGTSTDSAQDGEVAIVTNAGASTIAVAVGSTPDATATALTAAGAGFGLGPGFSVALSCNTGDKINVAALT